MKKIAILGSTGSIGRQALEVIEQYPDQFKVIALSAKRNAQLLISQAKKFKPEYIVLTEPTDQIDVVKQALKSLDVTVLEGYNNLHTIVSLPQVDLVIAAMVGFAGLLPTITAILRGKDIALANKETLVVAGEIVMNLAKANNVNIIPVDSEHSAIFQCLLGEKKENVEKIYLTASGGPFRGMTREQLKNITKEQALKHPNWNMGNKITIDSATLMNKGLEAIEARWLFGLSPDQIDIVIHPQSIIHSFVQFIDGSIKAQMSLPDMRLPIQFALTFPNRLKNDFPRFEFSKFPSLTFEDPDLDVFKSLDLALKALHRGGNMPCVLNAANEIAVQAFLDEHIQFLQIPEVVDYTLNRIDFQSYPNLDDFIECDKKSRLIAREFIQKL